MGTEAYVKEVFDIYCYGLNHNIWMEQGHLSHSTFKNIITAALRLKAYDWTQKFIANYANKLRSSHQKIIQIMQKPNYFLNKDGLPKLKNFGGN